MQQAHPFDASTFSAHPARVHATIVDRWALSRIHRALNGARIRLILWDGFELSGGSAAVATVFIKNRSALFAWLANPELHFGEAYMFGAIDVSGDLTAMLEEVYRSSRAVTIGDGWPSLTPSNDLGTARQNVHHHYDLGNDFYRLWLDDEMVYTCAFFPTLDATLEAAQLAKMDRVCQKLRLTAGERVVEAGCGWGSLALFMAGRYGVDVRAFNISKEQIAYARGRARTLGLEDHVEFVEDDYRNISGQYDVFVSVGMLEHVGLADYETFGNVIDRVLAASGRGLIHFIGRDRPAPLNAWIRRRIFPGGYPPTLREVLGHIIEPRGLSALDVENLRLHYATTIEHWQRRFEVHASAVSNMFDEVFVRAWRLYLAGSRAAFTTGWMQLFQVVFARSGSNAIPWSRDP